VPHTVVVQTEEAKELAEDKATFLDKLQGTQATKKHMCQFHI
jgi:hypothetical protein